MRRRRRSNWRAGRRTSESKMAAATAATRSSPLYREKRRTSASSPVSPFNSHCCPSSVLGASFVLLPVFSLPFLTSLPSFPAWLPLSLSPLLPLALLPTVFLSFSLRFCRALAISVSPTTIPLRSFSNIRSPSFGRSPWCHVIEKR